MQIKTINDYYDIMYSKFPDVPKDDIKKILNHGWKAFYQINSVGADVSTADKDFWCYVGFLQKNSLKYFRYYIKKLVLKLRIMGKRTKVLWNGYYYFALSDKQFDQYLEQQKAKGRKRKWFNYGNQILFKSLNDCRLTQFNKKYIFKVPFISSIGDRFYKENFISRDAELIEVRDTLKFRDILVNNNKYEYG